MSWLIIDPANSTRSKINQILSGLGLGKIKSMIKKVINERMHWLDVWVQQFYRRNESVYDDGWLMIANKNTTTKAGPTILGLPTWIMPAVPGWANDSSVGRIYSGHFYTFVESGWATKIRVWAPEVTEFTVYRVIVIREPNGIFPQVTVIDEPNLSAGSWTTVTTGKGIARIGAELLVYLDAINSAGDTIITGDWTYDGTAANNDPNAGLWNHRTSNEVIRFNNLDDVGTNRAAELDSIVSGSEILVEQASNIGRFWRYRVDNDPTINGNSRQYAVTVLDEGLGGIDTDELCNITATIPVAQSTQYVRLDNNWPTNDPTFATVQGFLQIDSVTQPGEELNAFGVDIEFQKAVISADWDLEAHTETATSAAVGIDDVSQYKTKFIEDLSESTTASDYDFSPVTKVNQSVNIETGDFLVYFSFEAQSQSGNRSVVVGLFVNDVLVDTEFSMEPKDSTNNPYPMKIIPMSFVAGYHDFRVDFGKRGGGGVAAVAIRNVRILIEPIKEG